MQTLQNDFLKISINPFGAELTSVKLISENLEYIWQADSSIWARHSPVLFPIVGRVKDNKYHINNEWYTMNQHGFARDTMFELIKETNSILEYKIIATAETKKQFPFLFEFIIKYELVNNNLQIGYRIQNTDIDDIYFSVGAHPGFNCPLVPDTSFEDYYLKFSENETTSIEIIEEGCMSGKQMPLLNNENKISLTKELFLNDALVFKSLKSTSVSILSNKTTHGLEMNYSSMPYLGIWTKPGTNNFVCLEPWCGIADHIQSDGDFIKKDGIIKLSKNQIFTAGYSINFF